MPYPRPTLSQLRAQVAADISMDLPGSDPLLRFSSLNITGTVQAGLSHLHYGFLDWISKQAVPFTSSDEYLEAWAALKNVYRKQPTPASGSMLITGATPTRGIPAGTTIFRGDGEAYTSAAAVEVASDGTVTIALTDSATGSQGNCAQGTVLTLGTSIGGIPSTGSASTPFTGGADVETDEQLWTRAMYAYANPPMAGAPSDYVQWALAVAGVTRAWCAPNAFGLGSIVVYIMLDQAEAANGGFPVGANGGAAGEQRATVGSGDQLNVANAIFSVQPATPVVTVCSPLQGPVNFTIHGIPVGLQAAAQSAIDDVFLTDGAPGGTVPIADVWASIAAGTGLRSFTIQSPSSDIVSATGTLPTRGTTTWD